MKTIEHYSLLYLVIRTWPQIQILKIQQPDLFTNILNPQQPGDKRAGKQDGAKQKPKANAPAGQENKATNKNAAEKNKEEDPQVALEKDVDELRKAIDGEFKLNSSWMCFGFPLSVLARFSLPFIVDFTYCVNVVAIAMLCYFFRSPVVSQIACCDLFSLSFSPRPFRSNASFPSVTLSLIAVLSHFLDSCAFH